MSLTDVEPTFRDAPAQAGFESVAQYRTLNRLAVWSVALAILSVAAFLFPTLMVLPAVGAVLGLVAIRSIKRYPEEFSGLLAARIGAAACAAAFVGAVATHATVYALEVPEGYERISFYELQPDDDPQSPIPPEAKALDGKKVFIKGYVYPDGQQNNIRQFVLVPDRGTCCFGGQPKLTDMIEVTIRTDDRIKYSYQMRKLAGVLRVDDRLKPVSGLGGVYYQLDAEYVK
ncbi:MAG: DUF3299 domain-containing protein [Planctomycetes bacterium]|nr:DUF3299 domain-containing protein [Planctomycetota bacterium]